MALPNRNASTNLDSKERQDSINAYSFFSTTKISNLSIMSMFSSYQKERISIDCYDISVAPLPSKQGWRQAINLLTK